MDATSFLSTQCLRIANLSLIRAQPIRRERGFRPYSLCCVAFSARERVFASEHVALEEAAASAAEHALATNAAVDEEAQVRRR